MKSFRIVAGNVLGPAGLERRDLFVEDGLIATKVGEAVSAAIDARDLLVVPGYIDLQINGGFGIDITSDPARLWQLGEKLPETGTTAFLPTVVSSPLENRHKALEALRNRPPGYTGAEPLGLHFEGPMISPQFRGAHAARHLTNPTDTLIGSWSAEAGVKMVTLAPELPGALDAITELTGRGVTVAAGHSAATHDEADEACGAGLRVVTHLFNAMEPFAHRAPNLAGFALTDSRLVAGLIVDGIHLHPAAVALAWRAKGVDGMFLVTDAVAAMGHGGQEYSLGDAPVFVDSSGVRRADGSLAGSALTMDQAVRNLIAFTGCTLQEAVTAASTTPASVIGDDSRGRIEVGQAADLVLLDADLEPVLTICGGAVNHVAAGFEERIKPTRPPDATPKATRSD